MKKRDTILAVIALSRKIEKNMHEAGFPPWLVNSVQHSQLLLAICFAETSGKPLNKAKAHKMLQTELNVSSKKAAVPIVEALIDKGYVVAEMSETNKSALDLRLTAETELKLVGALEQTLRQQYLYMKRNYQAHSNEIERDDKCQYAQAL